MKLTVIAFSRDGAMLCRMLCKKLNQFPDTCEGYISAGYEKKSEEKAGIFCLREPVAEWTERMFTKKDGLIFIGACGIAVRLIAPCLRDKYSDPAVVVMDDAGRHVISLLSGHIGKANELTRRIADVTGAEPVITTASDVHGIQAVDEWAAELGLKISDRELARKTAAAVLDGRQVGFFEDPVCQGYCRSAAARTGCRKRPDGCEDGFREERTVVISPYRSHCLKGEVLHLVPGCLMVGIGCKKGVAGEAIGLQIQNVLKCYNLDQRAIACLASIDRKSGERGLIAVAEAWGVPLITFPASVLDQIPGDFPESGFVREITGVGNVCERAACAAGRLREYRTGILQKLPDGWEKHKVQLLTTKYAGNGVTVAIAVPVYQEHEDDT